jgi:hypothetical protein
MKSEKLQFKTENCLGRGRRFAARAVEEEKEGEAAMDDALIREGPSLSAGTRTSPPGGERGAFVTRLVARWCRVY